MFTSQATIERRAAKQARLHGIEERLDTLESAAAIAASVANTGFSEDVSGMKAEITVLTERVSGAMTQTAHEAFLAAYSKRLDEVEANVKCGDVTKRLDDLDASAVRSEYVAQLAKRLDELDAANKEAAKARQERFDELADSIRKVQLSLEEIKQESAEALKSLEKKLTAKPLFQPKSNSSASGTNNKSSN
jgi:hypothetical protein